MCLHKLNANSCDNLERPLNLDSLPASLWSDRCDYLDINKCNNLNLSNFNFIVLQLNIRSILLNQLELKKLLLGVDVLLLSETFLSSKTEKLVNIRGYTVHTTN